EHLRAQRSKRSSHVVVRGRSGHQEASVETLAGYKGPQAAHALLALLIYPPAMNGVERREQDHGQHEQYRRIDRHHETAADQEAEASRENEAVPPLARQAAARKRLA